jgi:hypothetical protein
MKNMKLLVCLLCITMYSTTFAMRQNNIHLDFKTCGYGNSLQDSIRTYLHFFEKENNFTIHYNNSIYGALGGGEIFKINLINLSEIQKAIFVNKIKEMFVKEEYCVTVVVNE